MINKIFTALTLLLVVAPIAIAETSPVVNVSGIYTLNDGGLIVYTETPVHSSLCDNGGTAIYLRAGKGGLTKEAKNVYSSVVLTSIALNKPLEIKFDSEGSSCFVTNLKLMK